MDFKHLRCFGVTPKAGGVMRAGERRITHLWVVAIRDAARGQLFG
jgi:hypothetical protein